jgi:hypothetical protein
MMKQHATRTGSGGDGSGGGGASATVISSSILCDLPRDAALAFAVSLATSGGAANSKFATSAFSFDKASVGEPLLVHDSVL